VKLPGRLFRRYLLVLTLLAGGSVLISSAVQAYFSYKANEQALLEVQSEKAISAARAIQTRVSSIAQQIRLSVYGANWNGLNKAQRENLYVSLMGLLPDVTELSFVDETGIRRVHVSRSIEGLVDKAPEADKSREPVFHEATSSKPFYGVHPAPDPGGDPQMTIGIVDTNTAVAATLEIDPSYSGVTVAELRLPFARETVRQVNLPQGGAAYLIDSRGRLVADTDSSFQPLSTSFASLTQVKSALHMSDAPRGATSGRSPVNTTVLAAWARADPPGWLVFVEQPQDQAFAPLKALLT
jgi:hypothetical protein